MTHAHVCALALRMSKQASLVKSAIIKQEGSEFVLYSHHGRVLGRHPSRAKAIAQEQAIKANGG